MLGVRKEYRNAGVGRILKLRQREDGMARGIQLMEWTFDPLEIKNAYFNIERLGCIIRRYIVNVYGTTTSHLHGGLPTDRCVPEWWFSSARVQAILSGVKDDRPTIEARIAVPAAIEELRRTDSAAARDIQAGVTQQFQQHFGDGLAVVGFERTADAGIYLLGRLSS
jgi:predicted GNAT superfamily acetyltransferase